MSYELRHLRCFVAVADEQHFGRAAAALHLSQPTVSRVVADLEGLLGVSLLSRSTRHVTLTADGTALLGQARDALAARRSGDLPGSRRRRRRHLGGAASAGQQAETLFLDGRGVIAGGARPDRRLGRGRLRARRDAHRADGHDGRHGGGDGPAAEPVRAGQVVYVHGASGGVGLIATEAALLLGATVIAAASPAKWDALKPLGASVVDYRDPELDRRLRELAPGGVEAIAASPRGLRALQFDITTLRAQDPAAYADDLAWLLGHVEAGRLTPVVEAVALEDAPRAHRAIDAGTVTGRIVIDHALANLG